MENTVGEVAVQGLKFKRGKIVIYLAVNGKLSRNTKCCNLQDIRYKSNLMLKSNLKEY